MAGLIDNEMGKNLTQPIPGSGTLAQAASVGIDPETRAVDAAKESVSGQLDTLLKSDSAYIQRARTHAAGAANKRGLLNSSIAAGAGEAAAIDAALPIATADANVYGTASRDNMAAKNAALGATAEATNKASLVNADAANQSALQTLKGTQATELANIEANYKSLLQASQSASSLYKDTATTIAAINTAADLTPEAKTAAIQKQAQLLNAGLQLIGSIGNVNLSGLLNFSG